MVPEQRYYDRLICEIFDEAMIVAQLSVGHHYQLEGLKCKQCASSRSQCSSFSYDKNMSILPQKLKPATDSPKHFGRPVIPCAGNFAYKQQVGWTRSISEKIPQILYISFDTQIKTPAVNLFCPENARWGIAGFHDHLQLTVSTWALQHAGHGSALNFFHGFLLPNHFFVLFFISEKKNSILSRCV